MPSGSRAVGPTQSGLPRDILAAGSSFGVEVVTALQQLALGGHHGGPVGRLLALDLLERGERLVGVERVAGEIEAGDPPSFGCPLRPGETGAGFLRSKASDRS